jgi:hypothetical protein
MPNEALVNLEDCLTEAQAAANKERVPIAVVKDHIGNAEDRLDPYGYCPPAAVSTLHRHGTVLCVIQPQ